MIRWMSYFGYWTLVRLLQIRLHINYIYYYLVYLNVLIIMHRFPKMPGSRSNVTPTDLKNLLQSSLSLIVSKLRFRSTSDLMCWMVTRPICYTLNTLQDTFVHRLSNKITSDRFWFTFQSIFLFLKTKSKWEICQLWKKCWKIFTTQRASITCLSSSEWTLQYH